MGMLTHVSVNIFPIVMLLIIYGNNQKKATKGRDKQEFNMLVLEWWGRRHWLEGCRHMVMDILCNSRYACGWCGLDMVCLCV